VREWDYGDYEGLTSKQIKALREESGEKPWNIWTDGCPGGEYVKISLYIFTFRFFLSLFGAIALLR
jgi:broad specificity phosphatase PhoE